MFACRDEQDFMSPTPGSRSPEFQPDGAASADKAQARMALAREKGSHLCAWTHRRAANFARPWPAHQPKAGNQAVKCSQSNEAEAIQGERRRKNPGCVPATV